jgi:hypothetical protein
MPSLLAEMQSLGIKQKFSSFIHHFQIS